MKKKTWLLFSAFWIIAYAWVANAEIYSSISGKIIGEDTGKGVVGVYVIATKGLFEYGAVTDRNGNYAVKQLEPGTYSLKFVKESSIYIQPYKKQLEVILPRGKNVVNANFTLEVGTSVSGVVYAADRVTPMANVSVEFNILNAKPAWGQDSGGGTTDHNGNFYFKGLPEGEFVVSTSIPGRAGTGSAVTLDKAKPAEKIILVVNTNDVTGISGVITSSVDGKPIKNLSVLIRQGGEGVASAITNENGIYSVAGLAPGLYDVTAFWPTGGFKQVTNISVEAGKSTTVNFYFDKSIPTSWNLQGLLNFLSSLFSSDAYGMGSFGPQLHPICGGSFNVIASGPKKCKDSEIDILGSTCNTVKSDINSSDKICQDIKNKLNNKLSTGDTVIYCEPDCDVSTTLIECATTINSKRMYFCQSFFQENGPCGCRQSKMFHELIHTIDTSIIKNEAQAYACERIAYPCAKMPQEFEKWATNWGGTCH